MLRGVNLAGADFGSPDHRPGVFGTDYFYPTHAEVDYFVGKGMNVFRLPFSWENLQPQEMADFQADELARLDDIVGYATGRGAQLASRVPRPCMAAGRGWIVDVVSMSPSFVGRGHGRD